MSNKHIELVKKWLDDNDSVSLKELKDNNNAAWHAVWAADVAEYAARAAVDCATRAAEATDAAAEVDSEAAEYWVQEYEEGTNEK